MAAPTYTAFNLPVTVADLTGSARVVSRQQLANPEFFALVRGGLLDGSVTVVDEGCDWVKTDDEQLALTEPAALAALGAAQASWVGVVDDPVAASLRRDA